VINQSAEKNLVAFRDDRDRCSVGVFGDMTDFISRFSNEFIGRKNAFNGETPRLQSQRTRNDTERTVAVCQLGRIFVLRPTVAAATSKSTGKSCLSLTVYQFS
jgi:hypothetical protein